MKLSVVIPAHNESSVIKQTLECINEELAIHKMSYELVVINDHSNDDTASILYKLSQYMPALKWYDNKLPRGFGNAVRYGIEQSSGECVGIMMADQSDDPKDLVRFFKVMQEGGYDCVFGSRFIKGGRVEGYPMMKLVMNRIFNTGIQLFFGLKYNDLTNAFKLYKRETLMGLKPFLSPHFNLTLELPLKAIVRGYTYTVLPNSYVNRRAGKSKLRIKEMGSRYFFIFLYCLIEKYFSKKDYSKTQAK